MLWKWIRPNGDFQHLPSWRELVIATALSLRRHHADTLIVPMSLIRNAYRAEILGGLADAGEQVLHVFLEADAGVLRERLNARVTDPKYAEWDQAARELGMTGVDEMVAAAARQPGGTLMLRSDRLTPAELADEVLARRLAPGSPRPPADAAGQDAGVKRYLGCVAHQAEPIRAGSNLPAPLLRNAPDPPRRRRQAGAAHPGPLHADDHAQHLRGGVARHRRPRTGNRGLRAGRCALCVPCPACRSVKTLAGGLEQARFSGS